MKFKHARDHEPEINLIPFIDVLLVVVIFLMLTTTYSKFTQLQLNLPVADTQTLQTKPQEILIGVSSEGRYVVQGQELGDAQMGALVEALQSAAKGMDRPILVINADAKASHQSVIHVMEAAQRGGLQQLTFAAQTPSNAR